MNNRIPLPEIVTPEVNDLLVPPNQPEAITTAVLRLAGERGLWARPAAGARRTVEEKFTWKRVAERCLDAYKAFAAVPGDGR